MYKSNLKNKRLIHICLSISYLFVLLGLSFLLQSMRMAPPAITKVEANHATNLFEVRGENLSADTRIALIRNDDHCSSVIARKFMWERVFDVKVDTKKKHALAWALCRNVGLIAIDINNPKQPKIIRTFHINKFLWHLKIKDDKAYIACGKDGIVICDISSPAEARVLVDIDLPHYATDISVGPDAFYVSHAGNGISIITPDTLEVIKHLEVAGKTLRLEYHDKKLFAFGQLNGAGFVHIYSVDNPAQVRLIDTLKFEGTPRDYLFMDRTLYLANDSNGVGIVKINPDDTLSFKGNVRTPFRSNRLARYGNKIGVFGRRGDIIIYSLVDDGNEFQVDARLHACGRIFGAAIFGDYAIVAANEKGVIILALGSEKNLASKRKISLAAWHESSNFKVTERGIVVRLADKLLNFKYLPSPDPPKPELNYTGMVRFPSSQFFNAYTIANFESGTWIYVAIKGSGLHVVRINEDGTLEQRGKVELFVNEKTRVNSCATHADKLFLCTTKGLMVFDVHSAEHPVLLSREYITENIKDITFGGNHAYISSSQAGIKICPINPNNTLDKAETIDFPEHLISGQKSIDTTFAEGILYIACGYRGILSIDVRDPRRPIILNSIEFQDYCSKVASGNGFLGAQVGYTVYLLDISDPERMRMLCKLEDMHDFDIKNNELLQLYTNGIRAIPLPRILESEDTSASRLKFRLPEHVPAGRYDVFINISDKRSTFLGSMTYTTNGAQPPGWTFNPTR